MKENCGNCKYFYNERGDKVCRYEPPTAQTIMMPPHPPRMQPTQARISFHPPVNESMWCGKWEKTITIIVQQDLKDA